MNTREKLVKEKRKLIGWEDEPKLSDETKARLEEIATELKKLREREINLSVKHFINPSKEYLEKLQQISETPKTKIMPALGQKSQIQKWTDIFKKIPEQS